MFVIDGDLGKSAVTATEREGFQALVAVVGLGQVGIIFVTTSSGIRARARSSTSAHRC